MKENTERNNMETQDKGGKKDEYFGKYLEK